MVHVQTETDEFDSPEKQRLLDVYCVECLKSAALL